MYIEDTFYNMTRKTEKSRNLRNSLIHYDEGLNLESRPLIFLRWSVYLVVDNL